MIGTIATAIVEPATAAPAAVTAATLASFKTAFAVFTFG